MPVRIGPEISGPSSVAVIIAGKLIMAPSGTFKSQKVICPALGDHRLPGFSPALSGVLVFL